MQIKILKELRNGKFVYRIGDIIPLNKDKNDIIIDPFFRKLNKDYYEVIVEQSAEILKNNKGDKK